MRQAIITLVMLVGLSLFNEGHAQDTVKVNFTGMTPHVGQNLYLRVVDLSDNSEIGRTKMYISSPAFSVSVVGISPGGSYDVDFFADFNSNGIYDAPPTDHAWRITLDDVVGDTTVSFSHNTIFTDIDWKYLLTVNFMDFTPHVGQLFEFFLRDHSTHAFLDTVVVDPITMADFTVKSYNIMPGNDYDADFFADFNENGVYDAPPTDHAWRVTLLDVMGDTTISFTHNTSFTDIQLIPTGTKDFQLADFSLYPNPVRDELNIALRNGVTENAKVNIYDSKGMLVKGFLSGMAGNSLRINLSDLKSGLYILELTAENSNKRLKFIKE